MKYLPLLLLLLLATVLPLSALSPLNALGDTLTVIMSPILNVPAIQIPGETMTVVCIAPSATTNWQAQLILGTHIVNLPVSGSQYLTNPNRWELQTVIPQVPVFELYDLKVTASGGISDVTQNAVQVLPTRKTSYYFIHITDLHLPTRVYYPDTNYDTDSLSVNDFRSVIEDINILNPEFVLLTGDLLNEGEFENFNGQHWFGWTQRLLTEINVPCYVTNGNHDIGGWDSTPAPQGSARRSWWRYFGWPWLDNASTSWHQHTQDYDFVYGALHYIGLESYDNYDNWRQNIYGGNSFIYDQITWLNTTLALYPDKQKVLFYHYDFDDQLDLSALDVDMGLWGHIHSNSGSIGTFPYNLATRSVCDGNRAYRVIRVNGTQLQPLSTIYAGSSGANLSLSWSPSNNATADSVRATVVNNQGIAFDNALLKFRMPAGNDTYTVTNGVLTQVDRSDAQNVCYVQVSLAATGSKIVTVAAHTNTAVDDPSQPLIPLIRSAYPNPFSSELTVQLDSRAVNPSVKVYNLRGELIQKLIPSAGENKYYWRGNISTSPSIPSGVYLIVAEDGSHKEVKRVVKVSSR